VADRSLRPGEWRALSRVEVRSLYAAAGTQGDEQAAEHVPKGPGASGAPG
jgi:hypothetical protein